MKLEFSIYRYDPDLNAKPSMRDYTLEIEDGYDLMLLDALVILKEKDPTLTFRRSCREGVCGSDGMNVNGKNTLACITSILNLRNKRKKIIIRPLPGLPVIRDLVVDMRQFYKQYEKVKPYLLNNGKYLPVREYLQLPIEREKIDGLYECVLCACCSTFCPSFWWNSDKFVGPAGLLAVYRFLCDTRDTENDMRLKDLKDAFSVFRCHSIMNCASVCPKNLNPAHAIANIKLMLLNNEYKK